MGKKARQKADTRVRAGSISPESIIYGLSRRCPVMCYKKQTFVEEDIRY